MNELNHFNHLVNDPANALETRQKRQDDSSLTNVNKQMRQTNNPISSKQTQSLGTVGKALVLADIIANQHHAMRFNDILRFSPFPKATTYRLLQSLVTEQILMYDQDNQKYTLGLRLLRLAHNTWQRASLAPLAKPHLTALVQEIKATLHLAQMDNGQVLYVDKYYANNFETSAQIGRIAPAHCTGVGKVMLAHLPNLKKHTALQQQNLQAFTPYTITCIKTLEEELNTIVSVGVAFDRQEHELGVISMAAPILNRKGILMGAVSIASPTALLDLDSLQNYKETLLKTTLAIGHDAEYWHMPDAV